MTIVAVAFWLTSAGARATDNKVAESASTPGVQRFTEESIAVDFSVAPTAGAKFRAPQEGDDVIVRFKIFDVAGAGGCSTPCRGELPSAQTSHGVRKTSIRL